MVAMTVSLILIFVLLRVFTEATTSWQKGEAQADAFREARGALQLMARDLSTTITPVTVGVSGTTNAANPLLPTLVLGHNTAANPAPGGEDLNEEAYCLTNIINSATPVASPSPSTGMPAVQTMASETCAVGYFCQWMPAIATQAAQKHAPTAFALMRQFLNSDGVSARLQSNSGTTPLLAFSDPTGLGLYARNSLLPGTSAAATPPAADSTQLAAYIWDLKFRIPTTLATTTNNGTTLIPPYDRVDASSARTYDGHTTPYPNVLPPYVEIRFKALSTGAGRRLEGNTQITPADWQTPTQGSAPSNNYRQYILPEARQFVLRVPLINSNPLPNP